MNKVQWVMALCLSGIALRVSALPPDQPKYSGTAPAAVPAQAKPAPAAPTPPPGATPFPMIEWEALLPPSQRENPNAEPPAPVHDYLGEGGMAAAQKGSFEVNTKLNKSPVKIPGFVVPLDNLPNSMVREFFLVPYFGACVHVPPPPPNQIVYVKLAAPVKVGSMYDAVWVSGTMLTVSKNSRFGAAAYSIEAVKVEPYQY